MKCAVFSAEAPPAPLPAPVFPGFANRVSAGHAGAERSLRVYPVGRTDQSGGDVREPDAHRLAVGHPALLQGDEERPNHPLVTPGHDDGARLDRSPVAKVQLPDPAVIADEERPGVTRRVATLRGIPHHDLPGGPLPQRELLDAFVLYCRAGIPGEMQGEQEGVRIIDERRLDDGLDDLVLARKLRARVRDLDGFAAFVPSLVRDPVSPRLPDPRTMNFDLPPFEGERVAEGVDLTPRVEAIGLGNLLDDCLPLLRRRVRGATENSEQQSTDQGSAIRSCHAVPPGQL